MKVSDAGIELIRDCEGVRLRPYKDIAGLATIGVGHLIRRGETFPDSFSDADATALLCRDLETVEACIEESVNVPLLQHQFDALASLVFNIGCDAFRRSTLRKKLNSGDTSGAAGEFPKWSRVGVRQIDGLLARRLREQAIFVGSAA